MNNSILDMALKLQSEHGYVTEDDVLKIAAIKAVPANQVYEALSFYSMILLKKPAAVRIEICRGTSCHNAGGKDLIHAIEEMTGCAIGTGNGQYDFGYCECLGHCETAPNIMVNGRLYTSVTVESLKTILKEASH